MSTSISFDSNDLQTSSVITTDIQHLDQPDESAGLYEIAHANRSTIPYTNYPKKKVIVIGTLVASSISALDTLIDTFKAYFATKEGNLDIGYGGGTRRYIATKTAIGIDRPGGLSHAKFVVEFTCTYPFGRNTTTTSALSASGRTSASYTDSHTFVGTAQFMLPIWTITINSVTDGGNYLQVGNAGNGQTITITDTTFAASDVVVIDTMNRRVTVNDIEVDFIGAFPEFPAGSATLSYSDNFTARDFDIDVDYYPQYL